jgi:hypothetical protein
MKANNIIRYIFGLTVLLSVFSCNEFLEVDTPANLVPQEEVYSDARSVRAVINGLYTQNLLSNALFYYELPFYLTAITDDAKHNVASYEDLNTNGYTPISSLTAYYWTDAYKAILLSNDLIENLQSVTIIPEDEKLQAIGEAKYFRAYSYFVLAYLYGDAPWITTTTILETTLQPRVPKEDIVGHIIQDLKDVEIALDGRKTPNTKVTKLAASALLARNYLYHNEWKNAEDKANEVITDSTYKLEYNIDNVFLRTSKETIFATSTSGTWSSYIDRAYYGQLSVNTDYLRLTDDLINSFEPGDLRKEKWTKDVSGFLHPFKYHRTAASSAGAAEDFISLRLTEQYLIRAEARAQQDNLTGAIADVDSIRKRAGLIDLPNSLTKAQVLLKIEEERRHEFFAEEVHRWWDLVRTGRVDAVLGSFPGKQWEPYKALLPVPQAQLDKNLNLTQNPGYEKIR